MISNQKIKKLAQIAAEKSEVPKDIEKFVLTKMSKKELKDFLRYFRLELDRKRVYIVSSDEISKENMSILKKQYLDKEIIESLDQTIGGGIKIKDNDMVIDFSFKSYINDTIEKIKN